MNINMLHLQQLDEKMHIPGNISLFEGISSDDLTRLLSCLGIREKSYEKGETVIHEGEPVESIGLVVSGSIQIMRNDYEGNRMILSCFGSGSIFAESFVCAGVARSPVCVIASEKTGIVFLPFKKMIHSCESACSFHHQLIENMMKLLARKNLLLNAKIEIVAKRTIREKVLSYLEQEKRKNQVAQFAIPYSRNELSDFLCVDRSSLSRELAHMQSEGLITYNRNFFEIL